MEEGPHAPKDTFPVIYPQGYLNERVLANVLNGAMDGKLNCVNQKFIKLEDIPTDKDYFTVFDIRVSPYSMVILQPESVSAFMLMLSGIGKGFFNLRVNPFLTGAIQARGAMTTGGGWVTTIDSTPKRIPYILEGTPPPEFVDLDLTIGNHKMTPQMAGLYTYEFFIDVFNPNPGTPAQKTAPWLFTRELFSNRDPDPGEVIEQGLFGSTLRWHREDANGVDQYDMISAWVAGQEITVDGDTVTITSATEQLDYGYEFGFDAGAGTIPDGQTVDVTVSQPLVYFVDLKAGSISYRLTIPEDGNGRIFGNINSQIDVDAGTEIWAEISCTSADPVDLSGQSNLRITRIGNSPTYKDRLPLSGLDDVLIKYAVIG